MNKYNEILNRFCHKDVLREWMHEPFLIEDHAYSTDAHVLVKIHKDKVADVDPLKGKDPKFILSVIPTETNINSHVKVDVLKAAIKKAPLTEKMMEEYTTCKECNGSSEVEWEYESWTRDFECPACRGNGKIYKKVPSGEKVLSENGYLIIGKCYFRASIINKIVEVTELLNESKITFIYQETPIKANVIRIKDVDMLIMPCSSYGVEGDVESGVATIVTKISLT